MSKFSFSRMHRLLQGNRWRPGPDCARLAVARLVFQVCYLQHPLARRVHGKVCVVAIYHHHNRHFFWPPYWLIRRVISLWRPFCNKRVFLFDITQGWTPVLRERLSASVWRQMRPLRALYRRQSPSGNISIFLVTRLEITITVGRGLSHQLTCFEKNVGRR